MTSKNITEKSKKTKVGLSGDVGSFSEEATLQYLREEKIENFQLNYLITVEDVLSALEKREIDIGIFPIENSNGGLVLEAVYAMAKHTFEIMKLFSIDVRHSLLIFPGVSQKNIKRIISHPQALKQCRMYLKKKWPQVEWQEYEDTAKAAADLKEGLLPEDIAVIAHRRCAQLYGLKILERNIQDLKFNFTSFLAIRK